MKKLFGTDGKRGVANLNDIEKGLTPELAFQIGQAAGLYLAQDQSTPNRIVMGRDTRRSGPMIGAALASGFCSVGIDVNAIGVAPTGAISYLARNGEYGLGVVISASHNPALDNGIKLMTSSGTKISAEGELFIETHVGQDLSERPTGAQVGYLNSGDSSELKQYMAWLEEMVPERLDGVSVAIDAANGAASSLGVKIFENLGAIVSVIAATPDGMNINHHCGATHPDTIQKLTRDSGAVLGVSYDGDADRAVFSDSEGRLINGDRTMAIWCAHWKKHGLLDPPIAVGTVMSNGGFETYLAGLGIELARTDVGDKYVSAELTRNKGRIGGEQSGHIIFPEFGPTGDGLVTALQLARVLKREDREAKDFVDDFENWPQVLVNVAVDNKSGWDSHSDIQSVIAESHELLSGRGRVNVRASGTQPMIRIMVEADDLSLRDRVSENLVACLLKNLGGSVYSRVDLTYALGD